jgi:uncharacterized protein (DUF305 family)
MTLVRAECAGVLGAFCAEAPRSGARLDTVDALAVNLVEQSPERPQGLSLVKVATLCLAFAFAGFALSQFVGRPRHPSERSADVGFLRDMSVHHQQALDIAAIEATRGTDPILRKMGLDILLSQRGEMALMSEHLNGWGFDLGDDDRTAMAWMGMPVPIRSMPGLATPTQITTLRNATGADIDAQFIQLMAVHHAGGVSMAAEAVVRVKDRWTRRLAVVMTGVQQSEIDELKTAAGRLGVAIDVPDFAHGMPGGELTDHMTETTS